MSFAPRLALLLATLVFILIFGEGVARVMALVRSTKSTARVETRGLPVLTGMEIAESRVQGIHQGVYYRTNSHGIRGPEYRPRPPPGTFRILIAGDSVTVGWAVEEEQSYPKVLERLLADASADHPAGDPGRPAPRFEVINVGLAGVNAGFSNDRIRKFSEFYHPDLTIYGFTLNDIEGPDYRKLPRESRKALSQATWRRALRFNDSPSYLLRELWPRWVMVREWSVFHPSDAERIAPMAVELQENYFENPDAWAGIEAALDLHASVARAHDTCGHVLIHTHLTELGPEHRYQAIYALVADAARARGLTVTVSFPAFLNRDSRELWVNAFDVHPNPRAHEILARALFEGLRELPEECWRTRAER
jgi:lysophospholipase L1-like esterase